MVTVRSPVRVIPNVATSVLLSNVVEPGIFPAVHLALSFQLPATSAFQESLAASTEQDQPVAFAASRKSPQDLHTDRIECLTIEFCFRGASRRNKLGKRETVAKKSTRAIML
jgi:hypothetical protein